MGWAGTAGGRIHALYRDMLLADASTTNLEEICLLEVRAEICNELIADSAWWPCVVPEHTRRTHIETSMR